MFGVDLDELVAGLEKMRRRVCCYDMGGDFPAPSTCDCKFGSSGSGEQTGCPELRQAITLVKGRWEEMTLTKELFKVNARNTLARISAVLAAHDAGAEGSHD